MRRAFGSAVTRRQPPSAVRVAPAAGGGLLEQREQLGDFVKFLGILTSARTAPEFIGVEPVQRATWLCLMLFCAEHETGGVIAGCRQWGDRRWMQTCGVTKAEILVESTLFRFAGNDLVVWGYQEEYEASVLARREAGRKGGLRSGEARSKHRFEAPIEAQLQAELQPILERKDRMGGIGFKSGTDGSSKSVGTGQPGDKYERLQAVPQAKLSQWAATFCGDKPEWIRVYGAYVDQLGPEAFRAILAQFVGEIGAGEDGRSRGRVLVAKLKKAIAEKRKAVAT